MTRDVQLLSHVARDQKRLFEDEPNLFPAHMQPLIAAAKNKTAAYDKQTPFISTFLTLDNH